MDFVLVRARFLSFVRIFRSLFAIQIFRVIFSVNRASFRFRSIKLVVENWSSKLQHKVSYPSFFSSFDKLVIRSDRDHSKSRIVFLLSLFFLFFFSTSNRQRMAKEKATKKKRIPSIDIRHRVPLDTFFRASFLRGKGKARVAIPAAFSSTEIYDRRAIDNGSVRPRVRTSQAANTRRDPNSFRLKKEEKGKKINFPDFQVFQVSRIIL